MRRFGTSLRNRLIITFAAIVVITYVFSGLSIYQNLAVDVPRMSQRKAHDEARVLRDELQRHLEQGQGLAEAAQVVLMNVESELILRVYTAGGEQITDLPSLAGADALVQAALATQAEASELVKNKQGDNVVLSVLPITAEGETAGVLVASKSLASLDELFASVYPRLYMGLIISFLGIAGAGIYITQNVRRVFKEIEAVASEIAMGRFGQRIDVIASDDEVGRLVGHINHMAARLAELNAARAQFFSKVSHELRTPLTHIKGFALTVLRDTTLPEAQRRRLRIIDEQTDHLTHLVDDLLTLARVDAGALKLEAEPVNLADLATDVIETNQLLAADKGVVLRLSLELEDPYLTADRHRLQEIVSNLIDNALNHSERGDTIELRLSDADGAVQVAVADEGTGIAEENLPRIFDRFYQVDSTKQGAGLGLAIVKELVEAHEGTITVQSELNQGTRFTVMLPRQRGEAAT